MSARFAKISGWHWVALGTLLLSAIAIAATAVPQVTAQVPVVARAVSAAPAAMQPATPSTVPVAAPAVVKPVSAKFGTKPFWSDLTETQKAALAPLAADWPGIDVFRKKKWIEIASRFPSMKPAEQHRLQERMRVWAKLSPDERRVAREIYTRTKTLGSSEKSAQWLEYQQLPEAEKHRLASDLAAKKRVANLPTSPAVLKPPAAVKPSEIPALAKPMLVLPPAAPAVIAPLPAEPVPVAPPAPQPIPMIN